MHQATRARNSNQVIERGYRRTVRTVSSAESMSIPSQADSGTARAPCQQSRSHTTYEKYTRVRCQRGGNVDPDFAHSKLYAEQNRATPPHKCGAKAPRVGRVGLDTADYHHRIVSGVTKLEGWQ